MTTMIQPGQQVRHTLTGETGTVVSRHDHGLVVDFDGDNDLIAPPVPTDYLEPARATMHTSPIFVRSLKHNSLFVPTDDGSGPHYRLLGTPRHITVNGTTFLDLDLIQADGTPHGTVRFGVRASVHGVVGAI